MLTSDFMLLHECERRNLSQTRLHNFFLNSFVVPGGNCQILLFANVAFLIVKVNEVAAVLKKKIDGVLLGRD